MSEIYFVGSLVLHDNILDNVYLEVENGKFKNFYQNKPKIGSLDVPVIDYSNYIIAPGFVETHIHGYAGYDVMDGTVEAIKTVAKGLVSTGVTSWLPTTLTSSNKELNHVCQVVGDYTQEEDEAKIQGIFLEGPYFTTKHKGAQNPTYMSDPVIDELIKWQQLSNNMIKKIGLAPERDGVIPFVKYAVQNEIKVGLAHSDATFDQAKNAVNNGASIFVHTYNGMSGLHHRELGMVGAAMTLENCFAEVIADGHHVHPKAIEVLVKTRGVDQVVLVTDSMRAGGLGEGKSQLGEFEVEVKDGCARLVDGNSLAGSVLTMIDAVRNIVEWKIADLPSAIKMATINPAKSVGIADCCGLIEVGRTADFVVLDKDIRLKATYINGKCVFEGI